MGLSFGSIIFGAVKFGAGIYRMLKGPDKPPSLVDALPLALPEILFGVQAAVSQQGLQTKDQIDAWISAADSLTGSDPGALDIVPGLPPEQEEKLFDAILTVAKVLAYHKAGLPGYVENPPG